MWITLIWSYADNFLISPIRYSENGYIRVNIIRQIFRNFKPAFQFVGYSWEPFLLQMRNNQILLITHIILWNAMANIARD